MTGILPYIADILSQPEAVRAALKNYSPHALDEISARLKAGKYHRVVLTGMGASTTGAYPAWLSLSRLDIPVSLIETAELLHYAPHQVDAHTLLGVISQSGESAEIVHLLECLEARPPATLLGITNNAASTVGQRCDPVLELHAGSEYTVSTRTYLNTLAVTQLAARQLAGEALTPALDELKAGVDQLEAYLAGWESHVAELKEKVGYPKRMLILGRGPSLAAALTGGLILKEAAKYTAEGMSGGQFRHGPLELAGPDLTLLIYEGAEPTAKLNRDLALEVQQRGGRVFLLGEKNAPDLPTLRLPVVGALARPLAEILPLQMLTIALAEQAGFEPGKFRHIGKITTRE